MRALRRRHGRSAAHDLSYGEHYLHDHGDVLGMAIGVGAGAVIGGGLGGAGAVAGTSGVQMSPVVKVAQMPPPGVL